MELISEINKINELLSKHEPNDHITKMRKEIQERLDKQEEKIKARKAFKFARDKADFEQGRIYTFSSKYDQAKKTKVRQALGNINTVSITQKPFDVATTSECGQIQAGTSDTDLSSTNTSNEDLSSGSSYSSECNAALNVGEEINFLAMERRSTLRSKGQPKKSKQGGMADGVNAAKSGNYNSNKKTAKKNWRKRQ